MKNKKIYNQIKDILIMYRLKDLWDTDTINWEGMKEFTKLKLKYDGKIDNILEEFCNELSNLDEFKTDTIVACNKCEYSTKVATIDGVEFYDCQFSTRTNPENGYCSRGNGKIDA